MEYSKTSGLAGRAQSLLLPECAHLSKGLVTVSAILLVLAVVAVALLIASVVYNYSKKANNTGGGGGSTGTGGGAQPQAAAGGNANSNSNTTTEDKKRKTVAGLNIAGLVFSLLTLIAGIWVFVLSMRASKSCQITKAS